MCRELERCSWDSSITSITHQRCHGAGSMGSVRSGHVLAFAALLSRVRASGLQRFRIGKNVGKCTRWSATQTAL